MPLLESQGPVFVPWWSSCDGDFLFAAINILADQSSFLSQGIGEAPYLSSLRAASPSLAMQPALVGDVVFIRQIAVLAGSDPALLWSRMLTTSSDYPSTIECGFAVSVATVALTATPVAVHSPMVAW